MPQVLTTLATVTCPHAGPGTSTPSSEDWTVNGGPALVEGDTGVLACMFPVPCVGYTLQSMRLNATEINGKKVILVTDFNVTDTGLPLTLVEHHQVFDNSTTTSIPNGQQPPALPAPLADTAPPVVTAASPAAAFNTTTQLPVTIPITFTLSAANPQKWTLTLISIPTASHMDLTNGAPGAIPAPSGGSWSSGSLTVVLTLTLAFLSTLAPGQYYFYMTGVNQRGLTGLSQSVLTVS